jgi:hypothetical protein
MQGPVDPSRPVTVRCLTVASKRNLSVYEMHVSHQVLSSVFMQPYEASCMRHGASRGLEMLLGSGLEMRLNQLSF